MVDVFNNFFNNLLLGLFQFLTYLVTIILAPIDLLFRSLLPTHIYNNMLGSINNFFDNLIDVFNWFISCMGLNQTVLTIIKYELIFIITAPITIIAYKLAVKWFSSLKVG